jgi:hypothetical protein
LQPGDGRLPDLELLLQGEYGRQLIDNAARIKRPADAAGMD